MHVMLFVRWIFETKGWRRPEHESVVMNIIEARREQI